MPDSFGWQRALDIQMDTLKWCNSEHGRIYNYGYFSAFFDLHTERDNPILEPVGESSAEMARHVAITLWRGDTIFVTSDMLHLILQAAHDLPEDIIVDKHTILASHGFCLFEEPLKGEDNQGGSITVHAIAWEKAPVRSMEGQAEPIEAVIIYFFTDPHDDEDVHNADFRKAMAKTNTPLPPLALLHWYPLEVGQPLPPPPKIPGRGEEIVAGTIKLWLAMQILAQQTIGTPIRMNPDRATRKRYAREWGKDAPERLITLITLRRKSVKKDDEEPQKIEWSRRWVVRGFWRRQWYPSLKRHDWKYIHEYVKGPEDKPLILTERRVFNFRR